MEMFFGLLRHQRMPLPQRPRRVSAEVIDGMATAEPPSSLAATAAYLGDNTLGEVVSGLVIRHRTFHCSGLDAGQLRVETGRGWSCACDFDVRQEAASSFSSRWLSDAAAHQFNLVLRGDANRARYGMDETGRGAAEACLLSQWSVWAVVAFPPQIS